MPWQTQWKNRLTVIEILENFSGTAPGVPSTEESVLWHMPIYRRHILRNKWCTQCFVVLTRTLFKKHWRRVVANVLRSVRKGYTAEKTETDDTGILGNHVPTSMHINMEFFLGILKMNQLFGIVHQIEWFYFQMN